MNTPVTTKVKILLEGELTDMESEKVLAWFEDAFEWVAKTERYGTGIKLRDAKQLWEKELLEKKSMSPQNESRNLSKADS